MLTPLVMPTSIPSTRDNLSIPIGYDIPAIRNLKDKDDTFRWEEMLLRQDLNEKRTYGKIYFDKPPVNCGTAMKYK